jgi:hypothetical protein
MPKPLTQTKQIQPGDRFGRLTAIKETYKRYHWLCQCDCGANQVVLKYRLQKREFPWCKCQPPKARKVRQKTSELTLRQKQALSFVVEYISKNGISPSFREIMAAMGHLSPAPTQSLLLALREKGEITWKTGQPRTIQLLHYTVKLEPQKQEGN